MYYSIDCEKALAEDCDMDSNFSFGALRISGGCPQKERSMDFGKISRGTPKGSAAMTLGSPSA